MPPDNGDFPVRPFRLWHVNRRSEFVAVVAEADTQEALKRVWKRAEWRYQIAHDGTPIDENGFPILRLPGQDLTEKE
jgi:hypothetical protein